MAAETLRLLRTRDQAIERAIVRTRQLAKRQRTWFRHQLNVTWIELGRTAGVEETAERVVEQWRQYGATEITA